MDKRIVILSLIFGLTVSCGTARLTKSEAIELAENYVLQQGYTNKEIPIDSTILKPDFAEQTMSSSGIVDMRYNSLNHKASFQGKGLRKWTVAFQSVRDSTRFRLVHIYGNGNRIEMPHQDVKIIKGSHMPD